MHLGLLDPNLLTSGPTSGPLRVRSTGPTQGPSDLTSTGLNQQNPDNPQQILTWKPSAQIPWTCIRTLNPTNTQQDPLALCPPDPRLNPLSSGPLDTVDSWRSHRADTNATHHKNHQRRSFVSFRLCMEFLATTRVCCDIPAAANNPNNTPPCLLQSSTRVRENVHKRVQSRDLKKERSKTTRRAFQLLVETKTRKSAERERERQTDRQTDRQTHTHTHTHTHRESREQDGKTFIREKTDKERK